MKSQDLKSLVIAILLSTIVLAAWQYFYEAPKREKILQIQATQQNARIAKQNEELQKTTKTFVENPNISQNAAGVIEIDTPKLAGSISLQGLRFNNLQFKSYHKTTASDSPLVKLFTPKEQMAYFAEFGWLTHPEDRSIAPDKNSVWKCNLNELNADHPVHCSWHNSQGVDYFITIAVDENYLFTITQSVANQSQNPITLADYGRIYKAYSEPKEFAILHEGAIGVFGDVLKESTYEDLNKERHETFVNTPGSWAGFTDKYWLSAVSPDRNIASKTNFLASNIHINGADKTVYNVNFTSADNLLAPGQTIEHHHYLFAGAKENKLLSQYEKEKGFTLFDRAIDFGIFYFITKPLFWLISYFYSLIGNFGLAIILVTLTIKMLMFPLANKSFKSMNRMKELQPKIEQIKKQHADDRQKLNQAMMELYKKEKINPAAGCLPLFLQIPVFFSLYKVIFISIEMRQAPFYGWIKDLSVADPTSIWNLFGLMPWHKLGFLDIGLWPVIMGVTMFIQQKLGPSPTDPVQASVMKFMPLILMAMLYSLPAGLMIYWSFSNIFAIIQQYMLAKHK